MISLMPFGLFLGDGWQGLVVRVDIGYKIHIVLIGSFPRGMCLLG